MSFVRHCVFDHSVPPVPLDLSEGHLGSSVASPQRAKFPGARYARSRLKGRDLVYAIRGSIGDAEMVPGELQGANLTQDAARISYRSSVCGQWLLYCVKSEAVFRQLEAGALGAAIIAGVGSGRFPSYDGAVAAMVREQRTFEPDPHRQDQYREWFGLYRQMWPATSTYLRSVLSAKAEPPPR